MPFNLPKKYTEISLTDHIGGSFGIVMSEPLDHYEQWLADARPFSAIAKILIKILQNRGTLIDVGANIGTISIPVAKHGSRVVSVEMLPQNCMKLTLSAARNNLSRMTVHQAAATNSCQILEFAGDGPWGSVSTNLTSPQYAAGYPLDVLLPTLGDTMPYGDMAIKIDVEGHELEVLEGSLKTIQCFRPVVIFESIEGDAAINSRASRKFLQDLGYKLFSTRDAIPNCILSPYDAENLQVGFLTDYVAIPEEKLTQILERLDDFPIRDLTDEETLSWISETAISQQLVAHRVHAALVAKHLINSDEISSHMLDELKKILTNLQADTSSEVQTAAS